MQLDYRELRADAPSGGCPRWQGLELAITYIGSNQYRDIGQCRRR